MPGCEPAHTAAVARILGPSGRPVGTGFLIGPGLVATCAHTVATVLGADQHRPRRPDGRVAVDFPGGIAGSRMTARVCGWVPVHAGGSGDIAVLELDAMPVAVPVAVSWGAAPMAAGRTFRIRCAARRGPGIETVPGRFGPAVVSLGTPELDVDPGIPPISDHCSGAPVFDDVTGRVVGMATVCRGGAADGAPTAIPIRNVLHVLPAGPAFPPPAPPLGLPVAVCEPTPDAGSVSDVVPVVGVYGLRTFRVVRGRLAPVGVHGDSEAWSDGTCVARCDYHPHRRADEHRPPDELCSCGVYCFRELSRLRREYPMAHGVVAVIALEGGVLEGDHGWRAEAARVVALWERGPAKVDPLPDVTRYSDVGDMIRAYPGIHAEPLYAKPDRTSARGRSAAARWVEMVVPAIGVLVCSAVWTGLLALVDLWATHALHLGKWLAFGGVTTTVYLLMLGAMVALGDP